MRVVSIQGLRSSKREEESGSKLNNWANKDVCGETYLGDKEVMDVIQEELLVKNRFREEHEIKKNRLKSMIYKIFRIIISAPFILYIMRIYSM